MYLDNQMLEDAINILSLSQPETFQDQCILEFLKELMEYKKIGLSPKQVNDLKSKAHIGLAGKEEDCNGICRNMGKIIDKIDWKEVQAAVECRKARISFPVGTEIRIWLKDGRAAAFVVAAVDHYQHGELVFMSRDCIGKEQVMNYWEEKRGWAHSDLRDYLNMDVVKLLPDDLLNVIRPKETVQVVGGNLESSEDLLFLPSEYEVFGESKISAYNGTDKQYPYYEVAENRFSEDPDGYKVSKWLCSSCSYKPNLYSYVSFQGHLSSTNASVPLGVTPGFVIRRSTLDKSLG